MKTVKLEIPEYILYSKDLSPVDVKVYLFFLAHTSDGVGVIVNTTNICKLLNISKNTYIKSYKKLLELQLLSKVDGVVFARVYDKDYQRVDKKISKCEYVDIVKRNDFLKEKHYNTKQMNLLGYLYYLQAEYSEQVEQSGCFFKGLNSISKELNISLPTIKKYLSIFKYDNILDYKIGGMVDNVKYATKFYLKTYQKLNSEKVDQKLNDNLPKQVGGYNPDILFEEEPEEIKINYSEEEIKAKQEERDSFINYIHDNKEKLFQNIENIDLGISGDTKKMLDSIILNCNRMNCCIDIINDCINIKHLLYVLPKVNNNVFTQAVNYYSTDTEKIKELKQYA